MSQAFDSIKQNDASYVMQSYGRYPFALDHGHGAHVWDVDGKEYVDLLAGIAVCGLGHCNDELCEVIEKQGRKLWHISNLFFQEPQPELARRLVETAHFGKAFFCNSGAEANEALIKLARRYMTRVLGRTEAYEIITLSGCFHGRTLGTLAATGRENLMDGFKPVAGGFVQVPAGDLDALAAAITDKTCAVLIEVVQGEGGVIPLPAEYVQGVERLCRERGVLFTCDEVQAGMCRSGRFWAFQTCGVKPDIISMAKSLANGLPMGGILATDEVARAFVPGSHATTFGGTPIVSAVAAKTVEIMVRDHLAERAEKLGGALM
ncbi:MAG: aminotransferase class III-fold pyridoxal phosphate-dependent enzyme, partial [Desulfovibrionaceae bacterium]|nr:aminotransferase class III-fold pyridoxal phosphate-dependent enzyme [Desulfovibrionaceae bacterium]